MARAISAPKLANGTTIKPDKPTSYYFFTFIALFVGIYGFIKWTKHEGSCLFTLLLCSLSSLNCSQPLLRVTGKPSLALSFGLWVCGTRTEYHLSKWWCGGFDSGVVGAFVSGCLLFIRNTSCRFWYGVG
ncbi:hypothetical protein OH492_07775 [Vibrio chagasii]|nr:hypothetical protein [Vibrio chagasii]